MSLSPDAEWLQPITRKSLSEMAYELLRRALMEGEMAPGAELPLRPVSRRLGISATPLREALLRLAAESLLEIDPRGRIRVPHLTRAALDEIRKVRSMLEGNAAREAAMASDGQAADLLADLHGQMMAAQALGDFRAAIGLNTRFHLALCTAAGLPISHQLVENLWVRCGPVLSHLYDGGQIMDPLTHPHLDIIAAIRAGDPEGAAQALIRDIRHGGARLDAHVLP